MTDDNGNNTQPEGEGTGPTEKDRSNKGNLRPWPKGVSGNPAGRPKREACLTGYLWDDLEATPAILPSGEPNVQCHTWAQLIAHALIQKAAEGDWRAASLIFDRTEGKVAETVLLKSLDAEVQRLLAVDITKLSLEEIDAFDNQIQELLRRVSGR